MNALPLAHGGHEPAQPAGRHVVRMALKPVSLFQNAIRTPRKLPEMHRQRNRGKARGRRRAATHAQRNAIHHANRQRHNRTLVTAQQSPCRPRESGCLRAARNDPHCARWRRSKTPAPPRPRSRDKSPEPRPQRRSRGRDSPRWRASASAARRRASVAAERQLSLIDRLAAHPTLPFSAASTAAGVASTVIAFRRSASISASMPLFSSSVSSVPRWKSMV